MLQSKHSRENNQSEAFGVIDTESDPTTATIGGIAGGDSYTVLFKPFSCIFAPKKYLFLRYMPLQIELELVNSATDPIVSYLAGASFGDANTSVSWQIENVQAKCDVCTLDNGLMNSYTDHLKNGGEFPLKYDTVVSQTQSLYSGANGSQKVRLNVTRALTCLSHVYITLDKEPAATAVVLKDWNHFYSPMEGKSVFDSSGEIEAQLSLGSKLYPEYPVRSHSESYYQLKKALGIQSSNLHSFDITGSQYRKDRFVMGFDMEKVREMSWSGQHTRSGDILNVRFDHKSSTAADWATTMHIVLQSENAIMISDSGVRVADQTIL